MSKTHSETPPPGSIPERDGTPAVGDPSMSAATPPESVSAPLNEDVPPAGLVRRPKRLQKAKNMSLEAQATRLIAAADRKARRDKARGVVKELQGRLTEEEIRELLAPSREHLEELREMAKGKVKRNAMAQMQALKVMLEHSVAKPRDPNAAEPVTVVVNAVPAEEKPYQMPAEGTDGTKGVPRA